MLADQKAENPDILRTLFHTRVRLQDRPQKMSSEKKDIVSHPRYADFKTIRVAIQDNVGIIMFDRPKGSRQCE